MAKELNFRISGEVKSLIPIKLERKKLYGWKELRVVEPNGEVCNPAYLSSDGKTIIPKGAMKTGILREDGIWMEKSELVPIHSSDGSSVDVVPSSFDEEIPLTEKVTEEELLDQIISSVYQLQSDDIEEFTKEIGNDIYKFPFSYRGGNESSNGFLLASGNNIFILVGQPAILDYIGYEAKVIIDEPDDDEAKDDDFDFFMM